MCVCIYKCMYVCMCTCICISMSWVEDLRNGRKYATPEQPFKPRRSHVKTHRYGACGRERDMRAAASRQVDAPTHAQAHGQTHLFIYLYPDTSIYLSISRHIYLFIYLDRHSTPQQPSIHLSIRQLTYPVLTSGSNVRVFNL